jgi:predicted ferric reductase
MVATSSTTIWYTMRATGVVALALLTATVVLGILTAVRARTPGWPAFAQADLHKRISILAMAFLALHVLTAVVDTYVNVGWVAAVVPFASPYRPLWTGLGTVGVDLLLAVGVSSALRQRISARTWRVGDRYRNAGHTSSPTGPRSAPGGWTPRIAGAASGGEAAPRLFEEVGP